MHGDKKSEKASPVSCIAINEAEGNVHGWLKGNENFQFENCPILSIQGWTKSKCPRDLIMNGIVDFEMSIRVSLLSHKKGKCLCEHKENNACCTQIDLPVVTILWVYDGFTEM